MYPTLQTLHDSGLFDDASPAALADIEKEFAGGNVFAFLNAELGRHFHADSEALAECGIGDFLREVSPLLQRYGIPKLHALDHFDSADYTVEVNGESFLIYRADDDESTHWGKASFATCNILNTLLERAGSSLRAYAYLGGNDGGCVFLTPHQLALLKQFPEAANHPDQMPYTMIDCHPDYGAPTRSAPVKTISTGNYKRRILLWVVCLGIAILGKIYLFETKKAELSQITPEQKAARAHVVDKLRAQREAVASLPADLAAHPENIYTLSIAEDGTITRTDIDLPLRPGWVILQEDRVLLQRNAENETQFLFAHPSQLHPQMGYSAYLEAWIGNGYKRVSNIVEFGYRP